MLAQRPGELSHRRLAVGGSLLLHHRHLDVDHMVGVGEQDQRATARLVRLEEPLRLSCRRLTNGLPLTPR